MRISRLTVLAVLFVLTAFSLPVSAMIQYNTDARYDAGGTSSAFGEEIPVTLIISPGENDVKNLVITLREADAFIDDSNPGLITKKISPAGADINITQHGLTFTVNQLQKGQTITIDFIAYPKTLMQQNLHVADIGYSYNQLGDTISQPYEPITANMEDSTWFQFQKARSEAAILDQNARTQTDNARTVLYIGFALIIVAFVAIGYFWMKRRESVRECADLKESRNRLMHELLRKVELAEDNKAEFESLKKKLRTELGPDTQAGTVKSGKADTKSAYKDDEDTGFE